MLFNSIEFVFAFLPVVMTVFWWLSRKNQRFATGWLILASLVFYGWQSPHFLLLLATSMIVNFLIASAMEPFLPDSWARRFLVTAGVTINLGFIGYFKYSCFLIENLNSVFQTGLTPQKLILPIGISFYTFQQIAFLVDRYRNEIECCGFADYCLFVTFFPQLIAGPIVHPKELLPQFSAASGVRLRTDNLAIGLTIFFIGLFKKTVIADGLIRFSSPVFTAVDQGADSSFVEAWCAALAFTLQLYFDFSGYSDMALGLGRMFGIHLPLNFNSPYQAVNIIEFWRRWHMTLSRFLKDYIYVSLGGGRVGSTRRYVNLLVTMLLGGLWHGAGWTFVLWGGLHGILLVINHLWQSIKTRVEIVPVLNRRWATGISRGITFLAVVCGWVLFRATTVRGAGRMFESMLGLNGIVLPQKWLTAAENGLGLMTLLQSRGVRFEEMVHFRAWDELLPIGGLLAVVWFAPNTQSIVADWRTACEWQFHAQTKDRLAWRSWQPSRFWAVVSSVMTVMAILEISRASEFLYFQF